MADVRDFAFPAQISLARQLHAHHRDRYAKLAHVVRDAGLGFERPCGNLDSKLATVEARCDGRHQLAADHRETGSRIQRVRCLAAPIYEQRIQCHA